MGSLSFWILRIHYSHQLEPRVVLCSLSSHALCIATRKRHKDGQGRTAYGGRCDAEMVYREAEHTGYIAYVMRVLSTHSRGDTAHLGRIIPPPFRSLHFKYPLSSHAPRHEPSASSMAHSLRLSLPFTSQPIHGSTHESRANPFPFVSDSIRSWRFMSFCFCTLLLCISIVHDMYLKARIACRELVTQSTLFAPKVQP
jgi:hypothetical protein